VKSPSTPTGDFESGDLMSYLPNVVVVVVVVVIVVIVIVVVGASRALTRSRNS
jgi:hypothetical protein